MGNEIELMNEVIAEDIEIMKEVMEEDIIPLMKYRQELEKKIGEGEIKRLYEMEQEVV